MIFVGIDVGGTSSRCVAVDTAGKVLARGGGPGSNVHRHGIPEAAQRAVTLVRRTLAGAGSADGPVHAAVCTAGLDTEETARTFAAVLRDLAPEVVWRLENDAVAAWKGAFGAGESGVVAICGTGAVAFARHDGRQARAGGWGAALGDEGSGYDMGRRALLALLRHQDGMGPATSLREPVLNHLGLSRTESIIDHVHFHMQPSHVAALAPLVLGQAGEGDEVAVSVVDGVARSLAGMVAAAARTVRGNEEREIPFSLAGGVSGDEYFAGRVRRHCADPALLTPWHRPEAPPVVGAVYLAMEAAGTFSAVDLTQDHVDRYQTCN
ncbi:N-acetylglucosamine kinase [Amycolatopsis methanolica]|uniref:N-acetylglucosamine kinase-like protein n=1 Tax=Amycolatopsis methanolica 239 TaxID=1068978 RepID=A0A076MQP0_AMYME|nr:BadF/BadG/BcrA/BcrD ATPase family protein [Amycolatopsis methanolica]AIJ23208.1 N-acetylglucosamine kinase-like protein [Amycolatopsis methanolica 239]